MIFSDDIPTQRFRIGRTDDYKWSVIDGDTLRVYPVRHGARSERTLQEVEPITSTEERRMIIGRVAFTETGFKSSEGLSVYFDNNNQLITLALGSGDAEADRNATGVRFFISDMPRVCVELLSIALDSERYKDDDNGEIAERRACLRLAIAVLREADHS